MRTPTVSRLSTSNSSHAPRPGITLTLCSVFSVVLSTRLVEVDTRRPDQLADDDTLGAVDDEGALLGHHREVTHEHRLALDLAGVVVDELGRDEQRGRVRHVLVFALVDRRLDLVEARVGEATATSSRRSPRSGTARSSTSSRPPTGLTSPRAVATSRQRSEPISHSKDSVCTSSSPGTSRGSRSLAKEIRLGAPGTELEVVVADLLWRETAKMHPSSTSCDCRDRRAPAPTPRYLRRFGWRSPSPDGPRRRARN